MNMKRRQFITSTILTGGALALPAAAQSNDAARDLTVRGHVVCLTEELQNLYQVLPDCEHQGHVYSIKTAEGKIYPLLPTDSAAAVWMDERYRQRELNVVARAFPQTSHIEVIKYQAWRDGKLLDLDYFCDVCMISTHKPGPCECCQDPVVFRELPAQPGI